MKREVTFKAKSLDGGEWVEGDLVHYVANTCIRVERVSHSAPVAKLDYIDIEVDPATVCQFTGLLDSKGVRIFEWDTAEDDKGEPYAIIFEHGTFKLQHEDCAFSIVQLNHRLVITGSIHDSEATK